MVVIDSHYLENTAKSMKRLFEVNDQNVKDRMKAIEYDVFTGKRQ